jgi:DNA polymerase
MRIKSCQRCNLSNYCENIVEPRGEYRYPLMIIGEASGKKEDYHAVPFVGDSGIMLEKMFQSIGLSTQDCFVSNLCRCRPPENRTPTKAEIWACYPYLYREIISHNPKLILLLGNSPLKHFLGSKYSVSKARGAIYDAKLRSPKLKPKRYTEKQYNFLPTYHPSALIRDSKLAIGGKKWETWQDMLLIKSYLEI